MPYSKPYNRGVEIPACTRQCNHGDLTAESGFVGTAVKQVGYTISTPRSAVTTIAVGEQFFLITKGCVEVPAIGGATLGELIYINTTTGALGTSSGSGIVAAGRVTRLPGSYGMPGAASATGVSPVIPAGGTMEIDLDYKS